MKQVRSLKVVRDAGLNTADVADILGELGFQLEEDKLGLVSLTDKKILPSTFLASQSPLRN